MIWFEKWLRTSNHYDHNTPNTTYIVVYMPALHYTSHTLNSRVQ